MMILTIHAAPAIDNDIHIILLFGLGLVGGALVPELCRSAPCDQSVLPYSWQAGTARQAQADLICRSVAERLKPGLRARIEVVWAAGKAGFDASRQTVEEELASFATVVAIAEKLTELRPAARIAFHLVSSGGGLFEGQLNVGRGSHVAPLRPYGELKLAQEHLLLEAQLPVRKAIYRPSSIYGFGPLNRRLGLVPTLIRNLMQHRVTMITGDITTLRDYVYLPDIASFLARRLLEPHTSDEVLLLASGKGTSIGEIIVFVQNIFDRNAYVQFSTTSKNSANNTFDRSALPGDFGPTPLSLGIQTIARRMIAEIYGSPRAAA